MLSSKDGKMIILSSPSGAGKTTLVKKISKEKKYKISISHTTREPRQDEIDGVDYFFISIILLVILLFSLLVDLFLNFSFLISLFCINFNPKLA